MTLWQHDHITRRDIAIRPSFTVEKAEIQARPIRIRVGPLVRYTDHESATFWFELETPALVKVTCGKAKSQDVDPRKSGGADVESLEGVRKGYASTVRVGGRYYALVEVKGLSPGTLYDYQPALTSPPAMGDIPGERELERLFSTPPSDAVKKDIEEQIKARSYDQKTQFSFRTLMRSYDKDVEFVYGSCRKWAYDKPDATKYSHYDSLEAYAVELVKGKPFHGDFPKFMFLGGDQIYADDIGLDTRKQILKERFGARVPGPQVKDKKNQHLGGGAFAGRFAHRFQDKVKASVALKKLSARETLGKAVVVGVVRQLTELFMKNKGKHFMAWPAKDKAELFHVLAKAKQTYGKAPDFSPHIDAQKSEMEQKLAVCNHLLWNIPFEKEDLPKVDELSATSDDGVPHRSAGDTGGVHAADFAEYAFLYEWSWAYPKSDLPRLMASLPSFMIFDDHEVTDDWNMNHNWVKFLSNDKDEFQHWPNTIADALSAYLVYQHWGNVSPARSDPQTAILKKSAKTGKDALPELRKLIQPTTLEPKPSNLKWYYELPLEHPKFLVADVRTRKTLAPPDKDGVAPEEETKQLDAGQLGWIEATLKKAKGPAAFLALPGPFLMPRAETFTMKFLTGLTYVQQAMGSGSTADKLFNVLLGASMYLNTFNFYEDLGSGKTTGKHALEVVKGGSPLDEVGRRKKDYAAESAANGLAAGQKRI